MKTVVIHGQNHKGSTYHVGRILAEKAARKEEITEFFLPRDLNHFCLGCYKCLEDDTKCPFYDEKKIIMDAIEEAELLIFTTPTYCLRASAPMKSFIDLTFTNWLTHRPKASMFKKKAVVVSTAAGAGIQSAMKDIATCLKYWGVPYIKRLGFAVQAINWNDVSEKTKQNIEKKTTRIADKIVKKHVHVGVWMRVMFNLMRISNNKPGNADTLLRADYLHWKNNGWFDGKRPY